MKAMRNKVWMRPLFLLLISLTAELTVEEARAADQPAHMAAIGVNKFDLFIQYTGTASGGDGSPAYRRVTRAMAKKALDDAKDAGVKFMRVSMSGRTSSKPGDGRDSLDLWRTDPDIFWHQVDEMMDDLDARGIQIVPVLMWGTGKFPLMTGEPLGELLRNPQSKSWGLLTRFVTDFVSRYRRRNTVLFYELTNELNNYADLDLARRCNKNKETCEEGDSFTADDLIEYTRRFAALIRSLDTTHLISSGFSIPRGSAEHLRAKPEWTAGKADWRPDTREQFAKNLEEIHGAVDIISIHLYNGENNWRFGSGDAVDLLVEAKRVADKVGKPLFVGEFGDSNPAEADERSYAVRMMNKIVELRIPYSAVWVWEFYQNKTYVTHDNRHTALSLEPGYTDYLIGHLRELNGAHAPTKAKDTQPPRVVLNWPLECAVLDKMTDVYAVASDNSGTVRNMEFLLDGKVLALDYAPPYQASLSLVDVAAGLHQLTARAYDLAGNKSEFSSTVIAGKEAGSAGCNVNLQ
jgi:hypothetical protein